MTQKPTMGLLRQAVKNNPHAVIGLLNQYAQGTDHLIFANPDEEAIIKAHFPTAGSTNKHLGILQFDPGNRGSGGPGAGSHDGGGPSAGGGGNRGGGSPSGAGGNNGPGPAGNRGGTGPSGAGGGGNGPGSNDARAGLGPSDAGAQSGGVGPGQNTRTAPGDMGPSMGVSQRDPRSIIGVLGSWVDHMFSPTTPARVAGLAASLAPNPVGLATSAALGLGAAFGEKNAQVIGGIRDGSIPGSLGTDANGDTVGNSEGANYGGTAKGTRGSTGTASGGMGSGPNTGANINQQMAQNALNASTGVPGNIPSLGLLGQYQAPTQQWTLPGYGFTTPGYGYLQWGGQK